MSSDRVLPFRFLAAARMLRKGRGELEGAMFSPGQEAAELRRNERCWLLTFRPLDVDGATQQKQRHGSL